MEPEPGQGQSDGSGSNQIPQLRAAPAPTKYPRSGRLRLGNTANRDPFVWQVSDGDKETYQTQVNEAMARYKQEYTDWYESLSPDEQKVNKWYILAVLDFFRIWLRTAFKSSGSYTYYFKLIWKL